MAALRVVVDTCLIGLGYVRADRGTADEGAAKIAVVQPELGVLEEEVPAQSFHLFTSCTYDMAAYRHTARWALPGSVAATPGATATMPADRWPVFAWGELSAGPQEVTLEMYLPRDGGTSPERWFLAHDDRLALLARPEDGTHLRAGPVDRASLQELIFERLDEAVAVARSAAPQG